MMKKQYNGQEWSKNRLAKFQIGVILSLLFILYAFNYETQGNSFAYAQEAYEIQEIEPLVQVVINTPPKQKTVTISQEISDQPPLIEEKMEISQPETAEELIDDGSSEETITYRAEKAEQLPLPESESNKIEEILPPKTFLHVERMPLYLDCTQNFETYEEQLQCTQKLMMQHIQKNLRYPVIARENGIEDTVIASFVVNEDGKITDISIERASGIGFEEAVKQSVAQIPDMLAGEQNARKVNVKMYVPVKFRISN